MNEFLKLVDKYLDIPELDAAILNELVSRIVVHSPVRENGRKQVRIDLYFTYVGQIRIPLKIGRESLNESEPRDLTRRFLPKFFLLPYGTLPKHSVPFLHRFHLFCLH